MLAVLGPTSHILGWGEVEGGTWAPCWGWACSEQEPCTLQGSGW